MKTEIERVCEIMETLLAHQPIIDVPYEQINDIAIALVQEGYGDVKQAQIDVLNKLKDSYGLYYLSAFGVKERMLADILNPMIAEVQNAEDKG